MAAYKDYYSTLGVPKTATQKEIRSAFRKLAAKHHPDRNPDDSEAEERFKEINEAYTVLSDEEKRKFYDQYGSTDGRPPFAPGAGGFGGAGVNPENLGDFSDFFQTLFGGGGVRFGEGRFSEGRGRTVFTGGADPFGGFAQRQPLQQDVEATLTVGLEEAYRGSSPTIEVEGRRIEVTLPKGARDGSKLRLRGQAPGGGDLYLTIKLEEHPRFHLEGDNVRVTVDVPDYRAVLGGPVRVPTLDGEVEMTLPKNSGSGRVLRLRGQGWPKRDGTRGDELAEVRVMIPPKASQEQLELYQKLEALEKPAQPEAAV